MSALPYDGVARRSILALKEQGRTDLARPLGRPLAVAVAAAVAAMDATIEVVIVPASGRSYRRRGYDPVRLLARRAGVPIARVGLRAGRGLATQKTLDREGRMANVVGSMHATRRLSGRRFLLLDDVVTTGSTLVEAARALRSAGAEVVGCVTLAYTPSRLLGLSTETAQRQ
ncbi:MAG: hypothetical protein QOI70_1919 [Microbacteriaceae bacterium]|nr:hypothetical protein [Microbacteriaceae bacterium]